MRIEDGCGRAGFNSLLHEAPLSAVLNPSNIILSCSAN